ncbi:hypothetical protein [Mycolicibacterium litorale]|uniref:Uncharacterized protein n=1 Tax=Mycolicibacterium litorale TaxID=758802 RepID=A0AAD1IPZ6_9MYCO|nr:hypothetical protein [Mycolicibacterium litorale]MCV7417734.1 hypothetical protein [Mycolicibacterium litorale]TDY06876.1 hypothetical protein BCL50_3215 [Mycolicibacterium litorale]BBY18966.1 hypothetical protein MLIT_45580 [Mycolicibacterium litorale]
MTYTADHPPVPSSEELRARIPGWGADLDPADRPSVPKLRPEPTGAHWDFPERQPEKWPRERSIEHKFLTPVFGTSTPPRGLSGAIRKYSYARHSEGKAAHWLLLILADRVDAVEHHLQSFVSLRPDNPFTETGVKSEFTHNGLAARTDTKRVDRNHMWIDPILVGGPWLVSALVAGRGIKKIATRVRR